MVERNIGATIVLHIKQARSPCSFDLHVVDLVFCDVIMGYPYNFCTSRWGNNDHPFATKQLPETMASRHDVPITRVVGTSFFLLKSPMIFLYKLFELDPRQYSVGCKSSLLLDLATNYWIWILRGYFLTTVELNMGKQMETNISVLSV